MHRDSRPLPAVSALSRWSFRAVLINRASHGDHVGAPLFEGLSDRIRPTAALGDAGVGGWYEEYPPYGTTAWRAPGGSEVSAKRYKYTGMERDEETGLQCHGVRYYCCWLGRWTSADHIGLGDGANRYCYCHGVPVNGHDHSGLADWQPENDPKGVTTAEGAGSAYIDAYMALDGTINAGLFTLRPIRRSAESKDLAGYLAYYGDERRVAYVVGTDTVEAFKANAEVFNQIRMRVSAPAYQMDAEFGILLGMLKSDPRPAGHGMVAGWKGAVEDPGWWAYAASSMIAAYATLPGENPMKGVGTRVSQKQFRHVERRPEWEARGRGGYFKTVEDAQAVLDAAHSGKAAIIGITKQGHMVVRFKGVTGYNNNPAAGFVDQPTDIFFIKGTSSPSVVPTSPNWRPK